MPKLKDLKTPPRESQWNPGEYDGKSTNPVPPYFHPKEGINPFLRCPMPVIKPTSPDSLRQFYRDGTAQTRIIS